MKLFFSFVFALLAFTACTKPEKEVYIFTSHREPALDGLHYLYSYDGYHWDSIAGSWLKPEIGNKTPYYNYFTKQTEEQKYAPNSMMRDPSMTQGPDGTFHLVWTISWNGEQGFGYASSKDLIHWSEQREIKVMKDSLTNNVWAPEVFYDDEKEQFIVAWSSAIPVERYTAADSLGANKSHRAYYTTTKDFQTFTPAKAFYDPGFNSIDGFIVKRDKNDYVLIIKDNRKPGYSDLFCVSGPSAEGPYADPSVKFAPTYSEGPCAVKVGDEWLIYFDVYREGRFGAVSTKDFKNFTPTLEAACSVIPARRASVPEISILEVYPPLQAAKPRIIPNFGFLPIEAKSTPPIVKARITPAPDMILEFTHTNIRTAVIRLLGAFRRYFLINTLKNPVSSTTPIAIITISTIFNDGNLT